VYWAEKLFDYLPTVVCYQGGPKMPKMTLQSTEVVNTPLLLARLAYLYNKTDDDNEQKEQIVSILLDGYTSQANREFSRNAFSQLLSGKIPYKVTNGDTVVFDTSDEQV
jgi:hypothetical protein